MWRVNKKVENIKGLEVCFLLPQDIFYLGKHTNNEEWKEKNGVEHTKNVRKRKVFNILYTPVKISFYIF